MKKSTLALALFGAVIATPASAAIQTLSGNYFDLSYNDAQASLFGTPTIVGNVVQWFPSGSPGFSTTSAGDGVKSVQSSFELTLTAKSGYQINGFTLNEGGDYYYFGDGLVGVNAGGILRVTPQAPYSGAVTSSITETAVFTSNPLFNFNTKNWNATAFAGLATPAIKANVAIDNLLSAYTPLGSFPTDSFIEKKEAFLNVNVKAVPEPATYTIFLVGLLGLIGAVVGRRRQVRLD
ncbi:MAG: PEP-CTERM sorting domain-containing protein [Gammaproteobacteria bacterium]